MLPKWTKKDPWGISPERNFVGKKKSKNELTHKKAVLIESMKVAENCVDEGNAELP